MILHSRWPATPSDIKQRDTGHWKHYALNDLFGERALAWVDDQAQAHDTLYWRNAKPTLVIVPDPGIGLTREDMKRIDQFVARQTRARR